MGFLLAFSRKMYLTQYSHSIERRLNAKTAEKLRYTDTIAEYTSQINDIGDPDSPAVKKLEARKAEIEKYERKTRGFTNLYSLLSFYLCFLETENI